jgi:hypothetical protein
MKEKLILWTAAVILTFLAAFVHQRLSPYYPLSGSLTIGGEKVTYAFSKIHYGREPFRIMIRKDIDGISGELLIRKKGNGDWNKLIMTDEGNFITASVIPPEPGETLEYRAVLNYQGQEYTLPGQRYVPVLFSGKRPSSVMNVLYFFLFGGLLIAVRGGLEYFNARDKRNLFAVLAAIFFFVSSIVFYPFIRSYELDAINKTIPPINSLFDIALLLLFVLWFITAVLVIKFKNKIVLLLAGLLTLVIYQFSKFY